MVLKVYTASYDGFEYTELASWWIVFLRGKKIDNHLSVHALAARYTKEMNLRLIGKGLNSNEACLGITRHTLELKGEKPSVKASDRADVLRNAAWLRKPLVPQ